MHDDSGKYSIAKLNSNDEQLLSDTINDITTDPFNLIKGSQYAAQIILIASLKAMLFVIAKSFMHYCQRFGR